MNTVMTFASSVSTTIVFPNGFAVGAVQALPSVDAGNMAARVTNSSVAPCWVSLGVGGFLPAGPAVKGSIVIPAGSTVLVPTTAGTATAIGFTAGMAIGVTLTFERGTIATSTTYDTTSIAVVV